jgi:Ca2+-binding RTX toxin-like protein
MRLGRGITLGVLGLGLVLFCAQTAFAKTIVGNRRPNVIVGTAKGDRIEGRQGHDAIVGLAGADWIHGDGGSDVVQGTAGRDWLWGDGGDDVIEGGSSRDRIWGGWGSDSIEGGSGGDLINSGEDDGLIDSIDCGPGRDRAVVGRGDRVFNCEIVRRLRGVRPPAGKSWNGGDEGTARTYPGTHRDYMAGGGGDDELHGDLKPDILWGNDGDDELWGDFGYDWLLGGPGDDMLVGGKGSDRLVGGHGADDIYGNEGDDVIYSIALDGAADDVDCGLGAHDRAFVRPEDDVDRATCEWVRVIRAP